MKEIVKIIIGLTISCLFAGVVLGGVYVITAKAKKHNQYLDVQQTMTKLLGYDKVVPPDLRFNHIHRYIIENGDCTCLGYMLPVKREGDEGFALLVIDLQGRLAGRYKIDIQPEKALNEQDRKQAMEKALDGEIVTYADTAVIATLGGRRTAYLLAGKFPGFKGFIHVMPALDSGFRILGLEILEHSEDPGLGGEIEQVYFKNQFKGRDLDHLKYLKVIKQPLPKEYKIYLEAKKPEEIYSNADLAEIEKKYQNSDIHALTGATISSRAVTRGIKNIVKKFIYRIRILDRVISENKIPATF